MNCPLCGTKTIVQMSLDGFPSYRCPITVTSDQDGKVHNHYIKESKWDGFYEEEAILLPYRVTNQYRNTDYASPLCHIAKYEFYQDSNWRFWHFKRIMGLTYTLDILPYKRMRNRLKNIILFS